MKRSTYTKTALASLLTLYSFSSFATDFSDENIKKQESVVTSRKMGVMETSNKKLKEKMDRICNTDPKKKADELKKEEKLDSEKETKLAETLNVKNSNVEGSRTKTFKAQKAKVEAKGIDGNAKEMRIISSPISVDDNVNIIDANQRESSLKITFGGVIDAQGYAKVGLGGEDYKRYNIKAGKSLDYYRIEPDKIEGASLLFAGKIANIGNSSEDMGMIADAILHLRAENENKGLDLLYGADVQFHVPVTEGKGASQSVNVARSRSAHLFLNSRYGDLRLGYQFGPEALMRLDATRVATVDGATDSDWFRKVNLEGSAASFPFYATPRLYTESLSSKSESFSFHIAGKYNESVMNTLPFRITYYSPNYMGARFGLGYSPRYDSNLFIVRGDSDIKHIGPDYEHIVSAGISYEYDFSKSNIKVKTSAVGECSKTKEISKDKGPYREFVGYNDFIGINLGVGTDYKINEGQNIKLATSFAYLNKSSQPRSIEKLGNENKCVKIASDSTAEGSKKRVKGLEDSKFIEDDKNTMYWTAGAGYQYESFYTSLTYFFSRVSDGNNSRLRDIVLGVQYDLSPTCSKGKFVPYAALHYFMTNEEQVDGRKIKKKGSNEVAPSNKGALFLTGVRFSF